MKCYTNLSSVHKQRGADLVTERVHTETSIVGWHLCHVAFWWFCRQLAPLA
jgi:hypothetical protein